MRTNSTVFLLAVLVAAVLAFSSTPITTSAAPGDITGTVPPNGGLGLVVWGGGTVDALTTVAISRGCALISVWVATPSGDLTGYVIGAPAIVNGSFNAAFPSGLPPNVALVILCRAAPTASAPVPALRPTSTPPGLPASIPVPGSQVKYVAASGSRWITGAASAGFTAANGIVSAPAYLDCSTSVSPDGGWGEGAQVSVVGVGVNACDGWTYLDTGVGKSVWMQNVFLRLTPPAAVPTAVPPPVSLPVTPAIPSTTSSIVQTCIDGDFSGWEGDTAFLLCNGTVVLQVDGRYTYHYAYRPRVTLVPNGTSWLMSVAGIQDPIRVVVVSGFSTCITGQFSGLRSGNVYVLCNGQIWQQTEAWSWVWTWYGPDVLIYSLPSGGYRMKVQLSGVPHAVAVTRIR